MQGTTKSKHGPANSRYIEEFNNKYNVKNTTGYNDFTRSNRYKKSLIEYSEYSKKNKGNFDAAYVNNNLDSTYEDSVKDKTFAHNFEPIAQRLQADTSSEDYYGEDSYNTADYSALNTTAYNNQMTVLSNSNIIDYNRERTYYTANKSGNTIKRNSTKRTNSSIEKGRTSKSIDRDYIIDKSQRSSKFQKIESIEKLQKADRAKKYTSAVSAHNPASYSNVTSTKVTKSNTAAANSSANVSAAMTVSAKNTSAAKGSVKRSKTAKNINTAIQQEDNNAEYVYGNVALQLEPVRKPQTPEERRTHRNVEKNREKAFAMNLPTIACLTVVIMVAFTVCIQYLSLQSTIRVRLNNIKQMQSQLESMITDNDVLELNISNSTDLNSVYQRATEEFGMSYPREDQIVTYDSVESEYVRQYDNIPTN